jgi:hypothetical protein
MDLRESTNKKGVIHEPSKYIPDLVAKLVIRGLLFLLNCCAIDNILIEKLNH